MSKGNPVSWFEIYVDDMNRAKKFYEFVFERKLEKVPSPEVELWVFPGDTNSHGVHGALVKMEGMKAGQNSVLVYFSSADCVTEEKRVVEAGGKVLKNKFSISPNGFLSLVVDTEGNIIGLHSFK